MSQISGIRHVCLNYPEIVSMFNKRNQIMKSIKFETSFDLLAVFGLSNEEMISVRGGNTGEPSPTPPIPPIKI
jgi:hypothetical protein